MGNSAERVPRRVPWHGLACLYSPSSPLSQRVPCTGSLSCVQASRLRTQRQPAALGVYSRQRPPRGCEMRKRPVSTIWVGFWVSGSRVGTRPLFSAIGRGPPWRTARKVLPQGRCLGSRGFGLGSPSSRASLPGRQQGWRFNSGAPSAHDAPARRLHASPLFRPTFPGHRTGGYTRAKA